MTKRLLEYCKTLIFGDPLYLASLANGNLIAKLKDRQFKRPPILINVLFTSAIYELFIILGFGKSSSLMFSCIFYG